MKPVLAIRTDANGEIGAGHLMRCLALAQTWQDAGGCCTFLVRDTSRRFLNLLLAEEMKIVALANNQPANIVAQVNRIGADWLVLDGYEFNGDTQAAIASGPVPLLAFDDNGETSRYSARLILNQNSHASPDLYRDRDEETELLLGLDYVLLRREFRIGSSLRKRSGPVLEVLVTLGGADMSFATAAVMNALIAEADAWGHCTVVTDWADATSSSRISVRRHVDDMATLMRNADFAVTAGGSTLLEAAAVGLPALPLIVADNQNYLAHHLASIGGCFAPVFDLVSLPARLREALCSAQRGLIAEQSPRLIDGGGGRRVVSRMKQISLEGHDALPTGISLRQLALGDKERLFMWRNRPDISKLGGSGREVTWMEHSEWFERMSDESRHLLRIIEVFSEPAGTLRFDRKIDVSRVEITIYLLKEFTGRGYGSPLIRHGCALTKLIWPETESIEALIKPENLSSKIAFIRAGFVTCGNRGKLALHIWSPRAVST